MSDIDSDAPADAAFRERVRAASPGDIELAFNAALSAQDMPAAVAFLRVLASKDPHRAELLLNTLRVAMALRGESDTTPPTPDSRRTP